MNDHVGIGRSQIIVRRNSYRGYLRRRGEIQAGTKQYDPNNRRLVKNEFHVNLRPPRWFPIGIAALMAVAETLQFSVFKATPIYRGYGAWKVRQTNHPTDSGCAFLTRYIGCLVKIVKAGDGQFLNGTDTSPLRRMLAGAPAFALGWRTLCLSRLPSGCRTACLG
jgi:hypothetical protein